MKVNKKNLINMVEEAISQGVINGEEVDVTTGRIINELWPIIDHLQSTPEAVGLSAEEHAPGWVTVADRLPESNGKDND